MKATPILSEQEAAVRRVEAAINEEEGIYHVAGRYFASEADASRVRRWEAERRIESATTTVPICAMCFEAIDSQVGVVIRGRRLHPRGCAARFEAESTAAGEEEA